MPRLLDRAMAVSLLPPRDERAPKWQFGRTLLVCGCRKMSGAALLACQAALRSGAGLVRLASVSPVIDAARSALPEALLLPLPEADDGAISRAGEYALAQEARRADSLLFGCGVSPSPEGAFVLHSLLRGYEGTLVLDADGLNLLAQMPAPSPLSQAAGRAILTPHMGEFSRLCGRPRRELEAAPEEAALAFAKAHEVVLILKGAVTRITDGSELFLLEAPNSGMAKGGSGDVLAGLAAGLAAQLPQKPLQAAALAAWLHACAGQLARAELGPRAMLPSDVLARLPQAFLSLEGWPSPLP